KYIRDHKTGDTIPVENIKNKAQKANPNEQFSELYQAIGQLSKVDRLITMMLLEELDYEHIAEIMGISPGNLRVKIHRIKKKLKTLMAHG
ncbi:MAG: sigma-70 family RNA polymerase sigma factor, partial [Bacteroidota bacterium]